MAIVDYIKLFTRVLQNNDGVRALSWIFGILSILFNLMIIGRMIYYNKHYKFLQRIGRHHYSLNLNQSFSLLLFNLALSDLIGGCYLIILGISDATYIIPQNTTNVSYLKVFQSPDTWITSPTCTVERLLAQTSLLTSILITFMITIERYLGVFYAGLPRYRISIFRTKLIIAIFWFLGIILAIAGTVDSHYIASKKLYHYSILGHLCQLEGSSTFIVTALTYLDMAVGIAVNVVIAILYIAIAIRLKKQRQILQGRKIPAERNVQVITAWIIITNVITWIPVTLWVIIQRAMTPVELNDRENSILPVLVIMLYSNCALNPVIYIIMTTPISARLQVLLNQNNDATAGHSRDNMNVFVISNTITRIPEIIVSDCDKGAKHGKERTSISREKPC